MLLKEHRQHDKTKTRANIITLIITVLQYELFLS